MKYISLRILLLTILSSFCVFLAIPNEIFLYGNWIISLFSLTPLFIALILAPERGYAGPIGMIFGVLTTVLSYYWLAYFQDFSVWTITGTSLGYALYFCLFFPFIKRFAKASPIFRPAIFAAAWTVFEYFKTSGYLGFPWGLQAYPFASILPFVQIADLTGVWGISFIVVFIQAVLAETLVSVFRLQPSGRVYRRGKSRRKNGELKNPRRFLMSPVQPIQQDYIYPGLYLRREGPHRHNRIVHRPAAQPKWNWQQWTAAAALAAVCFGYGAVRLSKEIPAVAEIDALLVQQNIDSWLTGNEIESLKIGERVTVTGLEMGESPPDLIMWSETSFRRPYDEFYDFYGKVPEEYPFNDFLRDTGTYMIIGSPQRSPEPGGGYMNAVILIKAGEGIIDLYGKQHPVPFAEHVPFWELEGVRRFFQNSVGLYSAGWTLGKEYTLFKVPLKSGKTVSFGAPICFEDAFPYLCRNFILAGADLLVNLTNDSWSRQDSAQTQHFLTAYFRAIETRRTLVRSTNAGVSAVIDPHGRILYTMPFFEEAALRCAIPVQKESRLTVYMVLGDYLPYLLMALLIGVLIRIVIREKTTL